MTRLRVLFVSAALCVAAETFQPADVKIVGDLDYGQTSEPVECSDSSRFCAFVFNGNSGDRIDVTVTDTKDSQRQAFVAIADGGLKELVHGDGHLSFTLPGKGPDPEAYYIVFRDSDNKPAHFRVKLKRVESDRARAALLMLPVQVQWITAGAKKVGIRVTS